MISPYYEESGIVIYNADCRDVLPQLPKVELCLTDPPYGIGSWTASGGNSISKKECEDLGFWDIRPSAETLRLIIQQCDYSIIWGGNYLCDLLGGAWRSPLVWDKGQRGMHFADGEIAWTNFDFGTLRIFNVHLASLDTKGKKVHPTQKPLALMKWCIGMCKGVETVLDPFMGVGTTLRAAKDMGLKAIGVEKEEKYCEIAVERMRQKVFEFEQLSMIENTSK